MIHSLLCLSIPNLLFSVIYTISNDAIETFLCIKCFRFCNLNVHNNILTEAVVIILSCLHMYWGTEEISYLMSF